MKNWCKKSPQCFKGRNSLPGVCVPSGGKLQDCMGHMKIMFVMVEATKVRNDDVIYIYYYLIVIKRLPKKACLLYLVKWKWGKWTCSWKMGVFQSKKPKKETHGRKKVGKYCFRAVNNLNNSILGGFTVSLLFYISFIKLFNT